MWIYIPPGSERGDDMYICKVVRGVLHTLTYILYKLKKTTLSILCTYAVLKLLSN